MGIQRAGHNKHQAAATNCEYCWMSMQQASLEIYRSLECRADRAIAYSETQYRPWGICVSLPKYLAVCIPDASCSTYYSMLQLSIPSSVRHKVSWYYQTADISRPKKSNVWETGRMNLSKATLGNPTWHITKQCSLSLEC
jgi:hypothetical protein